MSSMLLVIRNIEVENANAVAGLTWGFPSVGQFLGFTHALDRKMRNDDSSLSSVLGGCAIVCHEHQTHSRAVNHNYIHSAHRFCLTRNPLTQKGATAPFNEEARMHLKVSLILEVLVEPDEFFEDVADDCTDLEDIPWFLERVRQLLPTLRLAGGVIKKHGDIEYCKLDALSDKREKQLRKLLFGCLPGFALVDRSELIRKHHVDLQKKYSDISSVAAWMDFAGLRYRCELQESTDDSDDEAAIVWQKVALPETGWLVPIVTGYNAIEAVQDPGTVLNCRDTEVPFCAVEAVYGVGQWLSPHRLNDIEALIWRYHYDSTTSYRFKNTYQTTEAPQRVEQ